MIWQNWKGDILALISKIMELSKRNYSVNFLPKTDRLCFTIRVSSPTSLFFSERMISDREFDFLEKHEECINDILDELVFKLERRINEIEERFNGKASENEEVENALRNSKHQN